MIQINFILGSTIFIGFLNLIAPIFHAGLSKRLYIFLTTIFFCNILLIDWLFLNHLEISLTLCNLGSYDISIHLEPLGIIFINMLSILWIFALLYTLDFLEINNIPHKKRFLFFVNATILSGCFIALSANLFTMFIGYEILTLCTIPLIANHGKVTEGLFRYLKILMPSALALFLPAILIVYNVTGSGDFIKDGFISQYFSNKYAIFLLLMFIFGIAKTALFPLHSWLPAAMVASYPVSSLLHAVVVVKSGLFCIYKILLYVFGINYLNSLFFDGNWIILFPIITIIYSSIESIRHTKIKMILAYSTINQLSIALLSAFIFSYKGMIAAILHMIAHAFTKISLFYGAGGIYSLTKANDVRELIGVAYKIPRMSLILLIAGLSLIGFPPFAGFISKFYIMLAAADQENWYILFTLGASSIFSVVYMARILIFVFRKKNISYPNKSLPITMQLSIFSCLFFVVAFALFYRVIYMFLMESWVL